MEIELRDIEDRNVWEEFLKSSPMDYFLQTWEWGEFSELVGKSVTRIGMYLKDELVGVAQLIEEPTRFGKIIYCPRGPVIDWSNVSLSESCLEKIVEHISSRFKPMVLRVDPAIAHSNMQVAALMNRVEFHNSYSFWQVERAWMLDLKGKTDEQLLSGMRKNSRYYLKKAQKSGVVVSFSRDPKDAEVFAHMLYDMSRKKGFIALPQWYISKQIELLSHKYDMFRLYVAKKDEEVIAGGVFSYYGGEVSYLHGASGNVGDTQAPYLIQWKAITDARDLGFQRFNFWGVVEEKNYHPGYPGFGYSNFKKGFGGYLEEYMRMQDYVYKPLNYKLLTLQEMYRKWRYKGN